MLAVAVLPAATSGRPSRLRLGCRCRNRNRRSDAVRSRTTCSVIDDHARKRETERSGTVACRTGEWSARGLAGTGIDRNTLLGGGSRRPAWRIRLADFRCCADVSAGPRTLQGMSPDQRRVLAPLARLQYIRRPDIRTEQDRCTGPPNRRPVICSGCLPARDRLRGLVLCRCEGTERR